ncbi:Tripartite-type tricarboxylate transporter, receptor component TctC [Variovorax sp. HW608]|uniref:Bug family tripartite tricarboxylate transporter substrate binding protein n=1 Tax=Variovorax sp. HW608 TaxID=1034889 RepID=UPI0008201B5D|nr:tripartite tricarboxylate transporter substrate binding protein [Variovorax sp. HW608]SCK15823.1 Tripartite-type tricarboxylate transporter, receptor component TctC [Variovorax sp. HW608]
MPIDPLRRRLLQGAAAGALGAVAFDMPAWAEAAFPSRPLRLVVPNGPGGAADLTARAVGQKLAAALGKPVVIDNRPSAGGVVAGETVARAAPDGHTLLLISSGTAVSAALFKRLPFDTLKDFAPVSQMARFDLGIAVAQNSRFKSLADLLAHARANPGKLNIGTPQIGTTQNLAAELFKLTAGIQAQVVPFNGTPPAVTAVMGGEIDAVVDILGPLLPHLQGKALRALAVLGRERAPELPEVPAVRESGGPLADFNVTSWNGLAVPAGTPPAIVERLSREVQAAVAQPDVKKQLQALNLSAQGSSPAQLRALLDADIQRWSEVIAKAGLPKL